MTQPTQRTRAARINSRVFHRIRVLSRRRPSGRRRARGLPELAEVLCEFLAGGGPVCLDGVAELDHVALEVEFVFLEPRDVEFFAAGAAFELAVDVLVVVADDPEHVNTVRCLCVWIQDLLGDNASRGEAFCALGHQEHAPLLDGSIDIVALICAVGEVVVRDVVDLVLLEEVGCDDPGAVGDDLVDPFAVTYALSALSRRQNGQTLALVCLGVARDADYELDLRVVGRQVGEGGLGLLQRAHVANVEEIEDTVGVHSNRAVHGGRVGLEASSGVGQTSTGRRLHAHCCSLAVLAIFDPVGGGASALLADALLVVLGIAVSAGVAGTSAFRRLGLALLLGCDFLQDRVFGALVRRVAR